MTEKYYQVEHIVTNSYSAAIFAESEGDAKEKLRQMIENNDPDVMHDIDKSDAITQICPCGSHFRNEWEEEQGFCQDCI